MLQVAARPNSVPILQERPFLTGRELFAKGEQGFLHSFGLDTIKTTPQGIAPGVIGQGVGLIFDERLNLAKGPERVLNGEWANGSSNWSVTGADATHVVTFADDAVRYQSGTTSPVLTLTQANVFEVGKWYEVTLVPKTFTSGALKIVATNSGDLLINSINPSTVMMLAHTPNLNITRDSVNVDITLERVSVREVYGNHAHQLVQSLKPTLRQNGANYYINGDGTDDNIASAALAHAVANSLAVKVAVPASIPALQILLGVATGVSTRLYVSINTDGTISGSVGNDGPTVIKGTVDRRGQTGVIVLTHDGTTVNLYWNGEVIYTGPQNGNPTNATIFRFLALSSGGGASAFATTDVYKLLGIQRALTHSEVRRLTKLWS